MCATEVPPPLCSQVPTSSADRPCATRTPLSLLLLLLRLILSPPLALLYFLFLFFSLSYCNLNSFHLHPHILFTPLLPPLLPPSVSQRRKWSIQHEARPNPRNAPSGGRLTHWKTHPPTPATGARYPPASSWLSCFVSIQVTHG